MVQISICIERKKHGKRAKSSVYVQVIKDLRSQINSGLLTNLLLNESAFFSLLDYIIILVDLCLSISAKKLPSTTELDRGIVLEKRGGSFFILSFLNHKWASIIPMLLILKRYSTCVINIRWGVIEVDYHVLLVCPKYRHLRPKRFKSYIYMSDKC